MNLIEREKTVMILGAEYQIRRLSPDKGSWAYFRLMDSVGNLVASRASDVNDSDKVARSVSELTAEEKARSICGLGYLRLGFEDIRFLQQECAKCAAVWETKPGDVRVPMPLTTADCKWAMPDLAQDAAFLTLLTTEVVVFSIAGFFAGSAGMKST